MCKTLNIEFILICMITLILIEELLVMPVTYLR